MLTPVPFPDPGPTPSQTSTQLPLPHADAPQFVPMMIPLSPNYAPVMAAAVFTEPGPGGPILDPNPLTGRKPNG